MSELRQKIRKLAAELDNMVGDLGVESIHYRQLSKLRDQAIGCVEILSTDELRNSFAAAALPLVAHCTTDFESAADSAFKLADAMVSRANK